MYTAEAVSKFSNLIIHHRQMKINNETKQNYYENGNFLCAEGDSVPQSSDVIKTLATGFWM